MTDEERKQKKQSAHDRHTKWQGLRRDQLSLTNNLFLTFGLAICGYLSVYFLDNKKPLDCCVVWGYTWVCVSITAGTLVAVSRLYDFRFTAKKIWREELWLKKSLAEDLKKMKRNKCAYRIFGCISWILLIAQIVSFLIGIIYLYVYVKKHMI